MEGRRSSSSSNTANTTQDRRQQMEVQQVTRAAHRGSQSSVPRPQQPQPIAPYDPLVYQQVVALLSSTANGCITEIGYRDVCAQLKRQETVYNRLVDAYKELQASAEHCSSDNARLTEVIVNHESRQRADQERERSDAQLIHALKEKLTRQEQELEILGRQYAMLQETQNMSSSDAYRFLEIKYQYMLDLLKGRRLPGFLQDGINRREHRNGDNQLSTGVVATKTEHDDVTYESADPILREVQRDLSIGLAVHTKSIQGNAGGRALSDNTPSVDITNVPGTSTPTSVSVGSQVPLLNPRTLPSSSQYMPLLNSSLSTERSLVGAGTVKVSASQAVSEDQFRLTLQTASRTPIAVSPVLAPAQDKQEMRHRSLSISTSLDPTPVLVSGPVASQMQIEAGSQHHPTMPDLPVWSPTPEQTRVQSTPQQASVTPPTGDTLRREEEPLTTVPSKQTPTPMTTSTPNLHSYDTWRSQRVSQSTSPSVLHPHAPAPIVTTASATTGPQHMDVDAEPAPTVSESHKVDAVINEGNADAEDDDEADDEDWSDLTDDESEKKRPVVDCISSIFYDDDNDERFCQLCNTRIQTLNLPDPRPVFSESSMRDLISHGKNEHPVAWAKLRIIDGGSA
ncbi:hypothetical protein M0805_006084 [Coniferiporia weirii]|nr:hypothetical protein M0805_006084 [Coniferiporia weirii]